MKTYQIEVRALGYETTTRLVKAQNLAEAKAQQNDAVAAWLDYNDLSKADSGLAFVNIRGMVAE